ncbi:MAG: SDR family oxidoreductase [Burkholderiales bacterium]|nr:SDR family oxidoreductase [Burkholderiales bacterium]
MSLLQGRSIVVTGAGRGIGRETALLCARLGASVIVNDPGVSETGTGGDPGPAAEVVREIEACGGRAVASLDSVADWVGAQRLVGAALSAFGRLDGVVNNAAILRDKIFHQLDPADWDAVVKTDLYGPFYVSRAAAPHFREQSSGAMVHMTSGSALIGNLAQAHYMAAKLGVVGLSKSIALDMARYNVRSNCVSPTAMSRLTGTIPTSSRGGAERLRQLEKAAPAKIAALVAFLLSDLAREVNGQVIGARANELYVYSQTRPLRLVSRSEGWTAQSIAEVALPALRPAFTPLERTSDVFSWDPL